ncbi:hypothetical protein ACP4OV_021137 [Aristida adscensionis]
MRNLNAAPAAAGLGGVISVSTSVRFDGVVAADPSPPSRGVFARLYVTDVARFLAATGAPLLAMELASILTSPTAYRDDDDGRGGGGIKLSYATTFQQQPVRREGRRGGRARGWSRRRAGGHRPEGTGRARTTRASSATLPAAGARRGRPGT